MSDTPKTQASRPKGPATIRLNKRRLCCLLLLRLTPTLEWENVGLRDKDFKKTQRIFACVFSLCDGLIVVSTGLTYDLSSMFARAERGAV